MKFISIMLIVLKNYAILSIIKDKGKGKAIINNKRFSNVIGANFI